MIRWSESQLIYNAVTVILEHKITVKTDIYKARWSRRGLLGAVCLSVCGTGKPHTQQPRQIKTQTTKLNKTKQGNHRHQTAPRYRNAASGSRYTVSLPRIAIRPIGLNVTSSIKPEVHNISQRRQRRTEPRPRGSAQKIS